MVMSPQTLFGNSALDNWLNPSGLNPRICANSSSDNHVLYSDLAMYFCLCLDANRFSHCFCEAITEQRVCWRKVVQFLHGVHKGHCYGKYRLPFSTVFT